MIKPQVVCKIYPELYKRLFKKELCCYAFRSDHDVALAGFHDIASFKPIILKAFSIVLMAYVWSVHVV